MSGQVTGWIIAHPDAPRDRALWAVLIVMADAANTAAQVRITVRAVADRAHLSRGHAHRQILAAIAAGWLEVVEPGSSHHPGVYRFPNFVPRTRTYVPPKGGTKAESEWDEYVPPMNGTLRPISTLKTGRDVSTYITVREPAAPKYVPHPEYCPDCAGAGRYELVGPTGPVTVPCPRPW